MFFTPVIDFIERNDKFILTAHETPDGDAIGSECAMAMVLKGMGKSVKIFNSDATPEKFNFIDVDKDIKLLKNKTQLPKNLGEYVLFILDTNDTNNIGVVSEMVMPFVKEHFIIDHHDSEIVVQSGNLIQRGASSTAELLYQLFLEMNVPLDLNIAYAIYTAIVYDTGSFVYPKTTAITFKIAHKMVAMGVNPNTVFARVYECNSISSVILESKVLATLSLELHNHVAIQIMTKETILESGSKYEEADQIINIPLKAEAIRVSIFFKQDTNGLLRCSLRSKGDIDVVEIARSFGGGGHKNAAGFKCKEPIAQTQKKVLQKLKKYFKDEV
jgi:phosphoesterase RecJ-like protein